MIAKIIWGLWVRTKSQVLPMLSLPVPRRKGPPLSPLWEKVTGMKRGSGTKGEGESSQGSPLYIDSGGIDPEKRMNATRPHVCTEAA